MDEKTIAAVVAHLTEDERWQVFAYIGRLKTGGTPFLANEEASTETETETEAAPEKKRKARRRDPTGLSGRILKVMKTKIDGATPDEIYADFKVVNILRQSDSPDKIRAKMRQNSGAYMDLGNDRWIYRHIHKVKAA